MKPNSASCFDLLSCPIDGANLIFEGDTMRCTHGHAFPIVQGVPVLLREDVAHTIGLAQKSLDAAARWMRGERDDRLFIETLGVSDEEKRIASAAAASNENCIDPVVSILVGATNGIAYKNVIGRLDKIPLPELRLPPADADRRRLLDIGCSWGRWSIAAAAKGYRSIGIDPSLGAVLAAKRLADRLGLAFDVVVADARHLPFRKEAVDVAFSYSVLQHFSKTDSRRALNEIARVTRPDGTVKIQMASAIGLRSLQHLLRRCFREPQGFEVRYWMPWELRNTFEEVFGNAEIEVDCYFGLGLQPSDAEMYSTTGRAAVERSEWLRGISLAVRPLVFVADSLYLTSRNAPQGKAVTH